MKILTRKHIELYESKRRYLTNEKKAWAVFSYTDENGIEYRKAFWAPANTPEEKFWEIAPKELRSNIC